MFINSEYTYNRNNVNVGRRTEIFSLIEITDMDVFWYNKINV
jgi:hypothetical protein